MQHMLSIEYSVLTELPEKQFDRLFNSNEYSSKLIHCKTVEDIEKIINQFKMEDLLLGEFHGTQK